MVTGRSVHWKRSSSCFRRCFSSSCSSSFPLVSGFLASFTRRVGVTESEFVGLDNYVRMTNDTTWITSLANAGTILLVLPVFVLFPLVLALLIYLRTPGAAFFKAVFFLTWLLPPVIVGYLMSPLLGLDGLFNDLLGAVGLGGLATPWLGSTKTAIWAMIAVVVWAWFGLGVVIYLVGLATVPSDLFEAAVVDGAGYWSLLRFVAIPSLMPTIGFYTVVVTSHIFLHMFPIVFSLTGGGPGNSTLMPEYRIYSVFVNPSNFGYASALGVTLFAIILGVILLQVRYMYLRSADTSPMKSRMPSERLPVWRTPILEGRISQSVIGSAALGLVALAVLLPLAFTANTALKTPASFAEDNYGLAFPPNFDALAEVWVRARFLEGLQNAIIVAVMGVVMLWIVSCAAAFALTKLQLPRKSLILLLLLSAIAIPIQVIMAPFFNIMKDLGLLDQQIGLALAFCAFGVPINTFMFRCLLSRDSERDNRCRAHGWCLLIASAYEGHAANVSSGHRSDRVA